MLSRRHLKWLPLSAVTAVLALVMCFAPRRVEGPGLPPLPVTRGGVSLALVGAAPGRPVARVGAVPGDYWLKSREVQVTVGADGPGVERKLRMGALVDLAGPIIAHDRLQDLRPVLHIEGQPVDLALEDILLETEGATPGLTLVHTGAGLRLSTSVRLDPKRPWVRLVTRVVNESPSAQSRVQTGDRVRWPGGPTFVPRAGFVTEATFLEAPWIGRETRHLSYVLAFDGGPTTVSFVFDRVGTTEQVALTESKDLEPGTELVYRRTLVVMPGSLDRAAAQAFRALGLPTGRVRGRILHQPAWANVEVRFPDDKPLLTFSASGRDTFDFELPVGEYRIALSGPGGRDVESLTIESGRVALVDLLSPEPGTLRFRVTDSEGRPIPARWSVRGVGTTPNPDFGARQLAAGVRNVAYVLEGEGQLQLPSGRYRVFATRGFEYSIFSKEIEVTAEAGASVRATLTRELDADGWVGADFHVHAEPSFDSSVPLADRLISLVAEGVEFAAATDHNHVTDYFPTLIEKNLGGFLGSASGVEVTTEAWGHFIAFPFPPEAPAPPYAGIDPDAIFSVIRERAPQALIQVNHPRMKGIGYFDGLELDADGGVKEPPGFSYDFDSIEVVNGFELNDPEAIKRNVQDWFRLLDRGHRYAAVGNSDSHSLVHQWVGFPRTYIGVAAEGSGRLAPRAVAEAVLRGRAQISNGIFADVRVDGRGAPGDLVTVVDNAVTLSVSARAASWVDVGSAEAWANGQQVARTTRVAPPGARSRIQWQVPLRFEQDTWLVVIVRGKRPLGESYPGAAGVPFAIVNPIYLDVDGDGVFHARFAQTATAMTPRDAGATLPPEPADADVPDADPDAEVEADADVAPEAAVP